MSEPPQSAPPAFVADVQLSRRRRDSGLLGLLGEECRKYPWESDALRLVEAAGDEVRCGFSFDRAVLFTGHMIDAPDRSVPRFPTSAEAAVSGAIRRSLRVLRDGGAGTVAGIAGGASGGDLLFHEACGELGIPTLLRLTLPIKAFLETSVAPAGANWVKRFQTLVSRLDPTSVAVLGPTCELPEWLTGRPQYDVWQRTNLWIVHESLALAPERTLLAVWNGEAGDGGGGAGHLVEAAPRYGIAVAPVLDPITLAQQTPA